MIALPLEPHARGRGTRATPIAGDCDVHVTPNPHVALVNNGGPGGVKRQEYPPDYLNYSAPSGCALRNIHSLVQGACAPGLSPQQWAKAQLQIGVPRHCDI